MKNRHMLFVSVAAAVILFGALSVVNQQRVTRTIDLDEPIVVLLKATTTGQPMDFWSAAERGVLDAAVEFGVDVEITGPNRESEVQRQIELMEEIIERNPPLIVLVASEYNLLVPLVEQAAERSIPVITVDSGVNSDVPVSFIATDNLEAGRKAGEELLRLTAERTDKQIAIVSHIEGTKTAIDREAGVREALGGRIIAGTWFCDVDQEKAYRITLDLLDDSSIGGIVALNEVSTLGVLQAVAERGAASRVTVVGFDNALEELRYLERGILKATVVQRPYNMGYLAVRTAVDHLSGRTVPPFINTGSVLITAENMYRQEYQELLFPFPEE